MRQLLYEWVHRWSTSIWEEVRKGLDNWVAGIVSSLNSLLNDFLIISRNDFSITSPLILALFQLSAYHLCTFPNLFHFFVKFHVRKVNEFISVCISKWKWNNLLFELLLAFIFIPLNWLYFLRKVLQKFWRLLFQRLLFDQLILLIAKKDQ